MNEALTLEDHLENQLIATTNTISVAYRTFGETYTTYEEHQVRLESLEATDAIPVDHAIDIKLTIPLAYDAKEQLVSKGDRSLSFTVLGEARERGSNQAELDGKHSKETWFQSDSNTEIPVLAETTIDYTLHRPKTSYSRLALDGAQVGIREIQDDDPSFFLGVAANLLGKRSISVRRLGDITAELAVDSGRSNLREHGQLDVVTFTKFMKENGFSYGDIRKAQAERDLATFTYNSIARMVCSANEPSVAQTELHCTYFQERTRMDSTFYETDYTGWSPVDPAIHAVYSYILDPDTQEIGIRARAHDGRLRVSKYNEPDEVLLADDSRSLGQVLRHMRRSSETYIDIARSLFQNETA